MIGSVANINQQMVRRTISIGSKITAIHFDNAFLEIYNDINGKTKNTAIYF